MLALRLQLFPGDVLDAQHPLGRLVDDALEAVPGPCLVYRVVPQAAFHQLQPVHVHLALAHVDDQRLMKPIFSPFKGKVLQSPSIK